LIQAVFGDQMTVDFIPITKNRNGVSLPSPDESRSILDSFLERSGNLNKPGFIAAEYKKFILTKGRYYLGTSAGLGRVLLKIDSMLNGIFTDLIFSSKKLNRLQNFIECEAHRELFLNYLDIKRVKKE
jgi:poly-gamma-glutamate synthesis protein (capsule biosynthesis protein)